MPVLSWDKPEPIVPREVWLNRRAEDVLNMTTLTWDAEKGVDTRWKAKLVNGKTGFPQVEIRKDRTVIVLSLKGYKYMGYDTRQVPDSIGVSGPQIHIASAGPLQLTLDELKDTQLAIAEGMSLLQDLEDGIVR